MFCSVLTNIACVEINFSIFTTTTISHSKRRLKSCRLWNLLVRDEGSYSKSVFFLYLVKDDFVFFQREQVPGGKNVREDLAVVLRTTLKTLKNAPKSHRGRGLKMPKPIVELNTHPIYEQFRLLEISRN